MWHVDGRLFFIGTGKRVSECCWGGIEQRALFTSQTWVCQKCGREVLPPLPSQTELETKLGSLAELELAAMAKERKASEEAN